MTALIALHFLVAATAPALIKTFDRHAFLVLALVPGISFLWLLPRVLDVTSGGPAPVESFQWIEAIGLDVNVILTPLNGIMSLLVTGIGALVLVYCTWYFRTRDPEVWRFAGVLTAFAGAMLGLVLSDNLLLLYVFWELTTVLSFLLIGHNPDRAGNRRAAMNALIVTTFGGLAMLVGIIVVAEEAGTYRISALLADAPTGTATTVAVLLLAVGAWSKSALVPFHFWLPGAMAAPTPVSAYLHAAAMVKAGVFLVALLAPVFGDLTFWQPAMLILGLATMLIGGLRALRQYDIKLLLAYGTVSQLGFLIAMVGAGTRAAAFAGLALVIAHALFKSTLFLVVGVIDRTYGTRDLRELSGLWRQCPTLFISSVIATASMAGAPPFLGFTAKEAGLAAFVELGALPLTVLTIGAILTVAYAARFLWGAFATKPGIPVSGDAKPTFAFISVPLALTIPTVIGGFAGGWISPRIASYSDQLAPGPHESSLALWHGFNLPLALSLLCLMLGIALFVARQTVSQAQKRLTGGFRIPEAERGYMAIMRGVDRLAVELTGRTQRGSLPFYLSVILVVVVLIPGYAVARSGGWHEVKPYDSPAQLVVASVMAVAAVATVRSRRRLRAVILVGGTGYGLAMLFILQGAPDLALTQVLVETFLLVTFVLVLRRFPPFFSDRPFTALRRFRVAIGLAVGITVAGSAWVAASARNMRPISDGFAGPAVEYGGGDNIVNVILVDIRAWDTIGELSVVVVAASGIASLIFLISGRAERPRPSEAIAAHTHDDSPENRERPSWLRGGPTLAPFRRSLVFEVVTRLVFHPIIVFSLYLMLVGHNSPGGGFAGGLVAGLALTLRYLAGGRYELDEAAPLDAGVVLGTGLAAATLAALLPAALGGGVLQSAIVDIPLGPLGDLHLVTSVFFDIGVYLIVIGLALDVLRSLGGGIDQDIEEDRETETGGEVAAT